MQDIPEVHVHSPVAPHGQGQALAHDLPEVHVQSFVDSSLSPAEVFFEGSSVHCGYKVGSVTNKKNFWNMVVPLGDTTLKLG